MPNHIRFSASEVSLLYAYCTRCRSAMRIARSLIYIQFALNDLKPLDVSAVATIRLFRIHLPLGSRSGLTVIPNVIHHSHEHTLVWNDETT